MDQLPAYVAYVFGPSLTYELGLLVGLVVIIGLRDFLLRTLWRI
jgi:hypothetical protein